MSKAKIEIVGKLAAYALSCHEALVRTGEHQDVLPQQIIDLADAFGVPVWDLIEIGQKAGR